MPNSASALRLLRQVHLYFGVFIAPAILFFALTGALQTFSLHETTRGSDYKPPQWAVKLGQLHKKQTIELPQRRPAPPAAARPSTTEPPREKATNATTAPAAPAAPEGAQAKPRSHKPMKVFFLIVSLGLFTSTLTGIYMAYKYNRNKLIVTGLLLAGVILPLLLLPF